MLRSLFFVLALVVSFGVVSGIAEAAVTCPANFNDSGAGVCVPTNTGLSQSSVEYVLETFMKWLLAIFGFIAIIAFIISGLQYLTAAGDENQAETAKRNMKYSIIGILVALSGYVILTAIAALLEGSTSF